MDTDERLNEERIAALEQRLTALESRAEGCITQDEYRARLASLRAPGVEIPSEPVDVAEMQAGASSDHAAEVADQYIARLAEAKGRFEARREGRA